MTTRTGRGLWVEGLFDTYRGLLGGLAVAFWKQFGRPSGGLLGPLLGFLGASWGLVGASWAPAGGLRGPLGAVRSKCHCEFPLRGLSWGCLRAL